ncbi:uncharacterized protein BBA_05642 [Beauveria bassiana ARSEF 2860]|uniref:EF-hand domain-containing protein n=1 Tax=Beauveria bassiana (strain ARSEF 2860) TaxID=655819 RepID=J5JRC9_BEAB2|nr:uncharacterized protein BBA_05642 [Beauveria bassiana ARSEF 2860]EJP65311.1 hypothetical protein BBA_05642 [Beauveria bassiana ARSEF 2860]
MQSLFSVTNNVSLVTITVTPGTFLAVVGLLLCFLTLYIPVVPHIRFPRVSLPRALVPPSSSHGSTSESSSSALLLRGTTPSSYPSSTAVAAATAAAATGPGRHRTQKALPALPAPLQPPRSRGALLPAPPSLIEQLAPSRQLALPEFISSYWGGRRRRETTPPPPAPPLKHGADNTIPATAVCCAKSCVARDCSSVSHNTNFEPPASPITDNTSRSSTRRSSMATRSEPATEEDDQSVAAANLAADSEADSAAGGYSPPAWRRLGNGGRSRGFWSSPQTDELAFHSPLSPSFPESSALSGESDGESSDSSEATTDILERAIQTRLPQGSQSPEKRRNIRFAVRAEVHQRTEPIEAAVSFVRKRYQAAMSSWFSMLTSMSVALFSILFVRFLLQPVAPRPAGDLVKVAGIARSFEPLIYYSEHAVTQVHDLQATSVAVWDLGESVRSSDMLDATSIVSGLDALSETMRTLSVEMTKFFARVDGDVDGILNVMDWAKMHLNRLNSAQAPSTMSVAYDNIHNLLSHAHVLEDADGVPTSLGNLATYLFGPSNPQREQRLIQLLFTEFLTVLEESIAAELQHSVTLFALFEAVDHHFLNLARIVVRETSAQEELHYDSLASLWVRLLGTRADELRKFTQNRDLLRNVRDKTVRNKRVLIDHQGKLLTLQASLESLRGKLVSPLVRGANATTLSLEDQIYGISSVSEYLAEVRRQQKGKVMQHLFSSSHGRNVLGDEIPPRVGGFDIDGQKV